MKNINDIKIFGEKIYLRALKISDVNNDYLSWLKDPEVMQGIVSNDYNIHSLRSYVQSKISNEDIFFFAIILKSNDKHIGNIKLDFHDPTAKLSELGVLIGNKRYWGKGLGREACELLIDFGFNKLFLRKIHLAVFENNLAAIKIYESLGFQVEGRLVKHVYVGGEYHDKILMGLFNKKFGFKK